MTPLSTWDVRLAREALKGRVFLLGNKRAFSLSLPVMPGTSDTLLHSHKWFGAYHYGRKFMEAQVVRVGGERWHFLGAQQQVGFTMGLTSARREYEVEGLMCTEEFFVPDGVQGFLCTLDGDLDLVVEPEFDLRFARALSQRADAYEVEFLDRGAIVSNLLPIGTFDDRTETFVPEPAAESETRLYAAVEVIGEDGWAESVPQKQFVRRKLFRKDQQRQRFISHTAPGNAVHDHAPLWDQNSSRVYAPVRLHAHGHAMVVYGFGSSREEALDQLEALRDNAIGYQAQKSQGAAEIAERSHFETDVARVDTAYVQVLTRLMDGLVARNVNPEDTPLDSPATMIMAGNQYFHDSWKRDENIALGFLLTLGFYDLARDVIRDTWQLQDEVTGRLPQRIRAGEAPAYHSSDGTLWALWRLYQYWRCSGDDPLLYEILPLVQHFFHRSLDRLVQGLLPSGRVTAPDYLWETWMDTPHTPRDGFPIEIQMLWLACLRAFRPIFRTSQPHLEADMERAETAAWDALQRFNVRGMPADSLDEGGQVRDLITPNPYFCFGVGLDLGPVVERAMRDIGRQQLAGHQGIVTLAPDDWERVFSAEFLSDRRNVRGRRMRSIGKFNYHRGVEWNWLSQFFVQAELKFGEPDIAFRKYLRAQVDAVLDRAGIGGMSELFDLSGTRGPEFQAWSMAGFLEALHAFAGVRIDVPGRQIGIAPQKPDSWPQLSVRKWYGSTPFDVIYHSEDGGQSLTVDFPWGEPQQIVVDVSLDLPSRRAVSFLEVRLDGVDALPPWQLEQIPGTSRQRVRFSVPAPTRLDVKLATKRTAQRATKSA